MRALESETTLLRRLADLGISTERRGHFHVGEGLAASQALDVFFSFAAEVVDEPERVDGSTLSVNRFMDGDLLLYEAGVGRAMPPPEKPYWSLEDSPPPVYSLSFTRQFMFEDDEGEYFGMNHASLVIDFESVPSLVALPDAQIWGEAGPAWTREQLVERGADPEQPTGAAAWREKVVASPTFMAAMDTPPILFHVIQSDV